MDRQACPRNNIITNEISPINKAFSTDCIISPIKTEITGNDFSQFPFFHLPAIQGKSGDNNSWYPALMKAQAGTPFFSEISSPFPDTVSASLRSACRSLAVCRHCARYLLLRYWQSPYKSVLFSEIPGYFFSDLKELFLTQPVCLQSCILFLL